MNTNLENRDKTRFEHVTAVILENNEIGVQRSARLYNYSDSGLYIESDHRLEPETEIRLGIANSPFVPEPNAYETVRGLIKWRKTLKRSVYYYGYGIEIIGAERSGDNDGVRSAGSRQQTRVDYSISVKYEFDGFIYEGTTENVSTGGVFIKTRHRAAVGQTVKVDIPVKKKGKIKRLTGKVTWSNRSGFGVQFIRSK